MDRAARTTAFFALITLPYVAGCGGPDRQALQEALEAHVGRLTTDAFPHAEAVQDLYEARAYDPLWVDKNGPTDRFERAMAAFCAAAGDGLWPASYLSDDLMRLLDEVRAEEAAADSARADQLARLELGMTRAYLQYASDLLTGRVDPRTVGSGWNAPVHQVDLASVVADTAGSGVRFDLDEQVASRHPAYAALREALAAYRDIAARGGWSRVPPGDPLEPGAEGERVAQLRERLWASGDLGGADTTTSGRYDAAVAAAVARFQVRHGLEPDSVAGDAVLEAMNVPVEERIRQLEINLERWRWIPANLGSRYLYVNVPAFELHAFEGDREALTMRVVVGQEYDDQATPVFSDTMQYVVFNPYWNIPESIATDEIVPAARQDPGYLSRNDYEVVRGWNASEAIADPGGDDLDRVEEGTYRIRQRPGPQNALGRVKFMFPNDFNIYLHDTPADHLFERADRAYSHGCIRVEEPLELAKFVLAGAGLTEDEMRERMSGTEEHTVNLAQPLPVYILYWTAFVDEGAVHFRRDLYGQDAALDARLARLRPASDATAYCPVDDG